MDYSINNNLIGDQSLLNEVGRTNLVNFLTDGYLPTASTDKFSGSKYSTLRQDAYGRQLSVAYTGLQLMRQNGIEIRKETKAAIQDLLNKYKSDGGGNKYDNIQKLIATL